MRTIPDNIDNLQIAAGTYDKITKSFKAIRNINEITEPIIYDHMDDEWKNTCLERNWWAYDNYDDASKFFSKEHPLPKDLFELKSKILTYAGDMVCMPSFSDADTHFITEYGQLWHGKNHIMKRGLASHCHQNSAIYWNHHKDNTRICTGYALTDDGMWREHSWLIQMNPRSNKIIETTVPRILYFGYVMPTELCEAFYIAVDAEMYDE